MSVASFLVAVFGILPRLRGDFGEIFLIQELLHQLQPLGEGLQLLRAGVLHAGLVHLVGKAGGLPRDTDDLGGDAHGGGVRRDLAEDHGVGGDAAVVPHPEGPQDLGPGGDEDVVADGGVALALVLAGAAQGDAVVDEAVVPHLGGLADDDAHTVVDDQALADGGAGMDLDARAVPGDLGVQPGQKAAVVPPEPVAHPVKDHRVDALVEEEDLQLAAGGGVPALVGFQQAGEAALGGSFLHSSLLAGRGQRKSAPVPRKYERRRSSRFHSHLSLKEAH